MGGDDLDSDDDYLTEQVADVAETSALREAAVAESKKRKLEDTKSSAAAVEEDEPSSKKKKPFAKMLLEAGRNLDTQTTEQQAAFLSTALNHQTLLATNEEFPEKKLVPHHFRASLKETLLERLREGISVKRMKKWKNTKSPCVVVLCISARRAVAILKELSGMKVRIAKLFAKHMDIEQQRDQLRTSPFGLAVGTPNRLRALCESGDLSFAHTQLVVMDVAISHKAFTVCTLPDTAPDCMALLKDFAVPQLQQRKDIRMAFF